MLKEETDERQLALNLRAQWMRQMGLSEEEIRERCDPATADADLEEEREHWQAAFRLPQVQLSHAELLKIARGVPVPQAWLDEDGLAAVDSRPENSQ